MTDLDEWTSWMEPSKGDLIWVLREAAKPLGFTPNAASVGDFAISLETRGWLHEVGRGRTFVITEQGRTALAELEASR